MNLIKKLQQLPIVSKYFLNRYPPYRGAGIEMALLHKDLKCKAPLIEPNLRRNLGNWST
ncbi:hypothetical protein [Acinetobacter towneri]|uniref:hypothetical protein n=1 Tax=Acinetobacter towneri TaxID=202956 RepID=UPI001486E1B9|nr:hypothetical protein [Acinetobacter towneri]